MFSTDNNEYAHGLNDENEWEENIQDYDVPLDDEAADYFDAPEDPGRVYNETGFDPERVE